MTTTQGHSQIFSPFLSYPNLISYCNSPNMVVMMIHCKYQTLVSWPSKALLLHSETPIAFSFPFRPYFNWLPLTMTKHTVIPKQSDVQRLVFYDSNLWLQGNLMILLILLRLSLFGDSELHPYAFPNFSSFSLIGTFPLITSLPGKPIWMFSSC